MNIAEKFGEKILQLLFLEMNRCSTHLLKHRCLQIFSKTQKKAPLTSAFLCVSFKKFFVLGIQWTSLNSSFRMKHIALEWSSKILIRDYLVRTQKFSEKTNISYSLKRARVYVLNEWTLLSSVLNMNYSNHCFYFKLRLVTKPKYTGSKLTMEIPEQGMKPVPS